MIKPANLPSFISLVGAMLLFGFLILRALRGKSVAKIRPVPALAALDEVVGRAAEQGRPIVMAIGGNPERSDHGGQMMAGTAILRHLCKLAGQAKVKVLCPVRYGQMIPIVDAAMKGGYQEGGNPDLYDIQTNAPYYGSEMYGWHLSTMSLIAHTKAAATVFVGFFAMVGIMFTEAGSSVGAIQIGGSADLRTIPVLSLGADYSLISEEVFAAGAYLSQDPIQLATIAAQDIVRLVVIVLLVVGSIATSMGLPQLAALLSR
jgi:hypothetical protein